jgi:RNA polymerase sigma-70 factor, ECF subfamily
MVKDTDLGPADESNPTNGLGPSAVLPCEARRGDLDRDLRGARGYIRAIAMKYVRNDQDAEDVTQDAMLLAHRYRESFRGEARFSRRQRRHLREISASESVDADGAPWLEQIAAPTDLSNETTARDQLALVTEAVARLGVKYPTVFWKRYGEGRTETEIAKALGLSVSAVKTRAFRARQAAMAALV